MNTLKSLGFFAIIMVLFPALSFAASLNDSKAVFQLINDRLAYSRDIAAYKYVHHIPIDAPGQEHIVILNALQAAEKVHLDSNHVKNYINTQISVAKSIEKSWFVTWDKNGFPKKDL